MRYFMGIDMGTSSVKTLLMREDGKNVGTSQREYDIIKRKSEYAEQNMDVLWSAAKETIREIAGTYPVETKQIAGISYSGQMHGLVMVDRDGRLIRDAIIWADQRSEDQVREVYRKIQPEDFKNITLNDLSSGFLLSSLMWVREHEPAHYERAFKVLLPKDYIRMKMCGGFATDMSDASATVVFDTRKKEWAYDIIRSLDLRADLFPPCYESYEIAGELTSRCASETGLPSGIPVAYGGGDSLIQEIGNGVTGDASPWICNIGTSCSLNCAVEQPLFDPEFRTNTFCHVKENLWMLMGANLCGGIVLKWLKNEVFYMPSYDAMTELAETVPAGSEGLLFLPYLSGSRCPVNDPQARGMYVGLTLGHTRAHLIRSAMEGIVFGMKTSMDIFEKIGIHTERIIASGGGARGPLFLQMEADILGKEIVTIEGKEQACMGAAITAAVGTGCYRSYEEACGALIRLRPEVVYPNPVRREIYRERYEGYKKIYPQTRTLI